MEQFRRLARLIMVAATVAILALGALPERGAAAGQQCFSQTQFCAENAFLEFWTSHGATEILGYPIDQPRMWPDGLIRQFYERAILEYHPEKSVDYQVLLTRLGAALIDGNPRTAQAPINCNVDCRRFTETNHTLRAEFLDYWTQFGGLPVFGYPLTEPFEEVNQANGKTYLVQYFERNRFELHPENEPRYQVLLGRLGAESLAALGGQVTSLPKAGVPDYDGRPGASITPASAYVGTTFRASFTRLHANGSYTVVVYNESGATVGSQQFQAEADASLTVDIDSSRLGPGDYRAALIDSKGDELASVRFEVLFKAGG